MIKLENYNRLVALEQDEQSLRDYFAYLVEVKDYIKQRKPVRMLSLETMRIDDYTIDVMCMNVTLRFHLLPSYANARSSGRVVCLRKSSWLPDAEYNYVGEFSFTRQGETDMQINDQGETLSMGSHPDVIVMTFLDQAIEQGPEAFAQPKI